jgi:LDH2 family malate/lactate/ureidoglycolate dehydrogenase
MREWTTSIFRRLDLPDDDARLVAETLVISSLRGVDSHGLMRVPVYVARLRHGAVNPRPDIRVVQESAATAIVDGDHGMGQVVARFAMRRAIEQARQAGTAFVLVRNTNHFGAAAFWAELALAEEMIGWTFTNTPQVVAPWGSREAVIGNNPIAIAAPAAEESPLILDMALSMVAAGKLRYAARRGEPIPDDWALGPDGMPTTDPNQGLAGTLLPAGRHKGSGLSIMFEAMTGLLAGTGWSEGVQLVWENPAAPGNVATAFGAINIASFIEPGLFRRAVDGMVRAIRASAPIPGVERIYLPGEPEMEIQAERLRAGIPLPPQLVQELRQVGDEVGEPLPVA